MMLSVRDTAAGFMIYFIYFLAFVGFIPIIILRIVGIRLFKNGIPLPFSHTDEAENQIWQPQD